jgi:Ca2+-binding EF-hand superfamily protein
MLNARFPLATIWLLAGSFAVNLCSTVDLITKASAEDQADSQPDRAALFKQLDANGDGQVAEDEVSDDHRRLFGRLLRRGDADADGKLSLQEFTSALADDRPEAVPPGMNQQLAERGADGDRLRQFLEADPEQLFRQLDTNGDGRIEPGEVPQQARERLEQFVLYYDANRDKVLSPEEFRRGHGMLRTQGIGQPALPRAAGLLGVLDTDGDGKLSKEEIAAAPESLRKLDRDADGQVSPRELAVVLSSEPGQAPPPPATKRPEGGVRPDGPRLFERLRTLDADGDGKWSQSELPPFLRQQFARIDANKDGVADPDELRQTLPFLRRPQQ